MQRGFATNVGGPAPLPHLTELVLTALAAFRPLPHHPRGDRLPPGAVSGGGESNILDAEAGVASDSPHGDYASVGGIVKLWR